MLIMFFVQIMALVEKGLFILFLNDWNFLCPNKYFHLSQNKSVKSIEELVQEYAVSILHLLWKII